MPTILRFSNVSRNKMRCLSKYDGIICSDSPRYYAISRVSKGNISNTFTVGIIEPAFAPEEIEREFKFENVRIKFIDKFDFYFFRVYFNKDITPLGRICLGLLTHHFIRTLDINFYYDRYGKISPAYPGENIWEYITRRIAENVRDGTSYYSFNNPIFPEFIWEIFNGDVEKINYITQYISGEFQTRMFFLLYFYLKYGLEASDKKIYNFKAEVPIDLYEKWKVLDICNIFLPDKKETIYTGTFDGYYFLRREPEKKICFYFSRLKERKEE